ncbi:MAG TPA: NAD(P)H-dependent oxidoreductase [Terracidiphilus sp.]|nr:NAD(P)H-dependent oxidoreductase [Terracidiphilus sp.]
MNSLINVGLVYGSTRAGRFCDTVAKWAAAQIAAYAGFILVSIDPADLPEKTAQERIAVCDAFVIVTPEYNHGYPAPLKALIDSVGAEWHAKPVAFVSYGGASGGLRAVEQLRLVFAELHAVSVRDSVSFAGAWEQFDSSGALRNPERAQRSMQTMLARLRWWAQALRTARATTPYETAA